MVSINWCLKQKDGIKLIEPNENLALSYIKMAENSLGTMQREKSYNMQFAISACYYSMYYSLYSVLMKISIKCEIHSCTLEFMKSFLTEFYSKEDIKSIKKAFDARIIAQYYADKVVSKEDSDFVMAKAPLFISKSKDILSSLNEEKIKNMRSNIKR